MRDITKYEADYLADYGFEHVLVGYRRRLVLERVARLAPRTVVEVGCGAELLYADYIERVGPASRWVIAEPAAGFADIARRAALPNCTVIEAPLENAADAIRMALGGHPDVVICSGLLNEIADADAIIAAMAALMGPASVLHVNIPNALSMHRRLAVAMGLIAEPTEMSGRNIALQQHRNYTMETIVADLSRAGLVVNDSGGYFVKPFTHAQMEEVRTAVGDAVMEGLYELGRRHPEWASEIYVEAQRSEGLHL